MNDWISFERLYYSQRMPSKISGLTFFILMCTGSLLNAAGAAMKTGGSDSGGGQGVFSAVTGHIHFVDLYQPEELEQLRLVEEPVDRIFALFPPCSNKPPTFYDEAMNIARDEAQRILNSAAPYFGGSTQPTAISSVAAWSTDLHLRQLQDATGVPARYQIQLAIYRDGIAFFQEQAIALLPKAELKWLIVKESLRFLAKSQLAEVDNADIEEAVKLLYRNEGEKLLRSIFVRKLMKPNFQFDHPPTIDVKENYFRSRLWDRDLAVEIRSEAVENLKLIGRYKFMLRLAPARVDEKFRPRWDKAPEPEDLKSVLNSSEVLKGTIPAWALAWGKTLNYKTPKVREAYVTQVSSQDENWSASAFMAYDSDVDADDRDPFNRCTQ